MEELIKIKIRIRKEVPNRYELYKFYLPLRKGMN